MTLDRRSMMTAGVGAAGLGVATAVSAAAQAQQRRPSARSNNSTGIKPSGGDDSARLQAAVDEAAAAGGIVQLSTGLFLVRSLELRAGVRLHGSGPLTVLAQSGNAPVIKATSADGASIECLSVEGLKSTLQPVWRGLIEVQASRHIKIRDVTLTSSAASGIMLDRCSGTVTGCRIANAAKAGIFSVDSENGLEISHNTLTDIGNNGILVWRSSIGEDGSIVAMNRIERVAARDGGTGQNGNAINVFRAGSVLVTSNRIADCAFSAIRANSASNVQIMANNVSRVGEVALYAEFAFEGAVISGNLVDGAATGVSVTNFDQGGRLAVIQGNVIRNLTLHKGASAPGGHGISVEADASITGNTIEAAPTAGIQIGWGRFCRDIAATGNLVRNCTIGIAIASDARAGSVLVATNMISGASRGAIRSMDHARAIGEDLALNPPSAGRIRTIGNVIA